MFLRAPGFGNGEQIIHEVLPPLNNEERLILNLRMRKNVASFVKKGERVLVMFAGVAPFPIVIAKHSKAKEIYSVELGNVL
jgi:hypothetical protein